MSDYRFIVARLNGRDIKNNFKYYLSLVKKGIAGFIIFGGELSEVKYGIKKLQRAASQPLIIASDLEQGLGQQIQGRHDSQPRGTIFPPAMAIASAFETCVSSRGRQAGIKLLKDTFKAIAIEAKHAGINTIFAPVLDVNTNPQNPIIAARAFGEDAETVSFFGCEMIKAFQSNGIAACGKHFPGHGDTAVDSHIKLPVIIKKLSLLEKTEMIPFREAVKQGVKMIMLGHLKTPALEPSGIPASISAKAVQYLREKIGFKGIIITDAMNMGGIGKYPEEKAALMSLAAGVNIILHPSNPDKTVSYLARQENKFNSKQLDSFRKNLGCAASESAPDFASHRSLAEKLTKMSIKSSGGFFVKNQPLLVILDDDSSDSGRVLCSALKQKYGSLICKRFKRDEAVALGKLHERRDVITAIFSKTKAWKGAPSNWLMHSMKKLMKTSDVFISFGSPYLLDGIQKDITKIYAYWDSDICQKTVADLF